MNSRSWTEEHPILFLVLVAGGTALIIWFLFFRKPGAAILPNLQSSMGEALVSPWVPLP
jgi:hypothetical protein